MQNIFSIVRAHFNEIKILYSSLLFYVSDRLSTGPYSSSRGSPGVLFWIWSIVIGWNFKHVVLVCKQTNILSRMDISIRILSW